MLDEKFINAIKVIHKLLSENNIFWALIGSANLQLQGMSVAPHDLDIVVQLNDLYKMHKIFSQYSPSEIKELKPLAGEPAWEVKLVIDRAEVQILGEKDNGIYVSKMDLLTNIKFDGMEIPCLTLEAEAQAYEETKRDGKAKLIREFLTKTKLY